MLLRLKDKVEELADVKSFIWESEEPISWKPGQFMEYTLEHPNPDDRGIKRYFTISSAPAENVIRQTTRIVLGKRSSLKEALDNLTLGSTIQAEGPKGKFVIEDFEAYYVLIAGGIGVTPYRSMITQFSHDKKSLRGVLIYQNKDENFLFQDLFESYAKENEDFRILYQLEEITADNILEEIPVGTRPVFYISGPEGMVVHYQNKLLGMGFLDEQIKRDEFPGYDWPLT
jgi:ferredoxin-NADP reductase